MAAYEIIHACGHPARLYLEGPHSRREWRLAKRRAEVCHDCWQAQELATAQAAATAAGLPAWTAGSPAQRDWAERIRVMLLDRMDNAYHQQQAAVALGEMEPPTVEQSAQVAALYAAGRAALIEERTDARWWIDHREDSDRALLRLALAQGIAARPDLAPPELRPPAAPEPSAAAAPTSVAQEAPATPAAPAVPSFVLRPETPLSQTLATLVYEPAADRLVMRFPEYQEQMRVVMREMDFTWTDGAWVRQLATLPASERNPQNRLAETATQLVAAGFVVRLRDADAYDRARAGAFQPERRRWVRVVIDSASAHYGWLSLTWPRSDDLAAAANQLRGARFRDGCLLVPPGSADEIEEFARVYAFAISPTAQETLDEVHASLAQGAILSAPKAQRTRRRSGDGAVPVSVIPPTLPVPEVVEVADALRDDD